MININYVLLIRLCPGKRRYRLGGPGIESRWAARFSAPVQAGSGAHPASYTMGTGNFPGVKRPGRGVDHPHPYSVEVKERVELYLYSTSGRSWPVLGWTLPLPLPYSYPESPNPTWGPSSLLPYGCRGLPKHWADHTHNLVTKVTRHGA